MTNEERLQSWRERSLDSAEAAKRARVSRVANREQSAERRTQDGTSEKRRREHQVVESLLPDHEEIAARQLDVVRRREREAGRKRSLHLAFFFVPVLVAILYATLFLTPLYRATTILSVSSSAGASGGGAGGGLGMLGLGLSGGQVESFKVREFLRSRDAMRAVERETAFLSSFDAAGVDPLTRPHRIAALGVDPHDFYRRRVDVSIDVQSGLMTMRVEGLTGEAAVRTSAALIELARVRLEEFTAEMVSDQLDALVESVEAARARYVETTEAVLRAQASRSNVDGEQTSASIYALISSLELELADALSKKRSLLESGLSRSPLLAGLDSRIAALEVQISAQKSRLTGPSGKSEIEVDRARLEHLISQRELAQENLQFALMNHEDARQRTLAQKLYLTVVAPPEAESIAVFARSSIYVGLLALMFGALCFVGFQIVEALRITKGRAHE